MWSPDGGNILYCEYPSGWWLAPPGGSGKTLPVEDPSDSNGIFAGRYD